MIVKILGSASSNFNGVQYNDKKVEKGTGELMLMKNFPSFINENSSQEEVRNYLKSISKNEKALEYKQKYACDGMMIGRAAIGYPWIFNEIKHFFETGEKLPEPTISDRLLAVKQHAEWSAEWKGERLGLIEMRQHYSNYFRGIPHFKEFKTTFLQVLSLEEFYQLLEETEAFYQNRIEI